MGDIPSDWEEPGQVSPQGFPPAGTYAAEEVNYGQVDLSTAGRGNECSGTGGCGDVINPPP